jgi:hypothetical protein
MSLSVFAVAVHAAESVEKCTTGSVATAAVIITLSVWRFIVFRRRNSDTVQPGLARKSSKPQTKTDFQWQAIYPSTAD